MQQNGQMSLSIRNVETASICRGKTWEVWSVGMARDGRTGPRELRGGLEAWRGLFELSFELVVGRSPTRALMLTRLSSPWWALIDGPEVQVVMREAVDTVGGDRASERNSSHGRSFSMPTTWQRHVTRLLRHESRPAGRQGEVRHVPKYRPEVATTAGVAACRRGHGTRDRRVPVAGSPPECPDVSFPRRAPGEAHAYQHG